MPLSAALFCLRSLAVLFEKTIGTTHASQSAPCSPVCAVVVAQLPVYALDLPAPSQSPSCVFRLRHFSFQARLAFFFATYNGRPAPDQVQALPQEPGRPTACSVASPKAQLASNAHSSMQPAEQKERSQTQPAGLSLPPLRGLLLAAHASLRFDDVQRISLDRMSLTASSLRGIR